MIVHEDELLSFFFRHSTPLRSLLICVVGVYAADNGGKCSWGSALQRVGVLPLTEFAYDGLILYNKCHDAHSWLGHDAAEIREVLSTSGGSIAEELLPA